MVIDRRSITQEEPVHFRVVHVGPPPIPELSSPNTVSIKIDYMNKKGGLWFGDVSMDWFLPYSDALTSAVGSEDVFWVDWDYTKTPDWPPRMDDTTLDRLFKAVQNRQLVSTRTEDVEL